MHKKYNKHSKKDVLHRNSSDRKTHVKHKKENKTNDSLKELIKVPQNSKCDIKKKYGDIEYTENIKSKQKHKEKYKHKKSERNKSGEHHNKKHEKQSVHNIHKAESLLFQNERLVKRKESHSNREKRDKERLNKIEKYLEGLKEISHNDRGRRNRSSISLRSAENMDRRRRHMRREKTFHGETARTEEFYSTLPETKKLRDQKRKEKEVKKQKPRENKEKGSYKEKAAKNLPKQLFYCQIDNPLESFDKNPGLDTKYASQLYKEHKQRSSNKIRKHSSTKDRSVTPRDEIKTTKLEKSSKNRDRSGHSKGKRTVDEIKPSQRKTKRKNNHKSMKEPKSNVNLGPYDKYFVIDKKSETEDEHKHHKKRRHGKNKENTKKVKNDNVNENMTKEERKQRKRYAEKRANKVKEQNIPDSIQDQYREKIEDDIKSYFTKIQSLIDKKLEFILHGSSSKISAGGKENIADVMQNKKRRRSASKEEREARRRSKSMIKHRSRKHISAGNTDNAQGTSGHKSHTSVAKEKRKQTDEEFKHHKSHHKSPMKSGRESLGTTDQLKSNEREHRHHKRYTTPKPSIETMTPNRLINMVENPSVYSMKSKKSYSGEKIVVKEMRSQPKLRTRHAHKVTNNDNNQNRSRRESSSTRRSIGPDELTCAETANDFCLEDIGPPVDSHSKKSKRRPLNLECKTISIIGIPSQVKESIIFNETQTTTSLNVINNTEDPVEKKKKTKRFKLYYKYSLANDSCARTDSDISSDGISIVSDSYRLVSGNSEHNSEICLSRVERDLPKESRKIVFVMKRESLANISGDTSDNQMAIEHFSRKCRKHHAPSPAPSKLNNIVEEPSNMSCLEEFDKTLQSMQSINSDFHCKYFNILNSSSSVCNLHLMKKSAVSDWNIPMGRCKCRIFDNSDKIASAHRRGHENEGSPEHNSVGNINTQRNENPKKIKHRLNRDSEERFTSKSDMNVSYDSLHTDKNYEIKPSKNQRKLNLSSHLIENSTYTPSEIYSIRNHSGYPDNRLLQSDLVHVDRAVLKIKESVCQTESEEIDRDAIDEFIIKKAYQKYLAEMLESSAKEEDAKSKGQDMNTETKIPQPMKKGAYVEVTRIPSLLNKRHSEKTELNTSARETVEDIPQKYTKRSLIPERINPGSKFNQKKFIDMGGEGAVLDDKLKRRTDNSPTRNKVPSIMAGGPAAEVNTPKRNFNNGVGRNTENIEKHTGLVESQRSPTPKLNNRINRDWPNRRSPSQQSKRSASQQSKTPSSRTTEVLRPARLPIYPKLPVSILSGRFRSRELERPFSAREKSPNEKDSSLKTKGYHLKRSMSAGVKCKRPSKSDIKKKPRLVVKCTKARDIPVKKCMAINTSRVTVPSSNKSQKQTLSNSCSYKSKSNKGATPKSNFSFVDTEGSKITSLVGLDKFIYGSKLNSASASHARSLDRYTAKSINDQYHGSSRLFLTKDYIPQLNTYQRRKLYSESLRRKMRRNCQIHNVIAPQVFEVRYLTFEKENVKNESKQATRNNSSFYSNQYSSKNKNSTSRQYYRKKPSPRTLPLKKSRKHIIRSKENVVKISSRNPLPAPTIDVDNLSKFRKKQFPEMKIEDIFIKGNKTDKEKESNILNIYKQLSNIQSSSVILKGDTTSSAEFKSGNNNSNFKFEQNFNTETNFIHILDYLCKSIVDHCNSDTSLPREHCPEPTQDSRATNNAKQLFNLQQQIKLSANHDPCETLADKKHKRQPNDNAKPVCPENTKYTEKPSNNQYKESPTPEVSRHASCPALAGTAPSFEFLYEDDSKDLNKRALLESLTKPWDTILGYALHRNDTVIIHKETYAGMGPRIDQISNSPTDSGESGYSSNSSKKCWSATNFFKKPYVAALFKSPPILEVQAQNKDSNKSLLESRHSVRATNYSLMSERCHEYAQKVRMQSESRVASEDTFQEIPLNILLQRRSSTILGQCTSDCSICKEYADEKAAFKTDFAVNLNECESAIKSTVRSSVFLKEEYFDTFGENENKLEALIYYGNPRCRPSLEIVKLQKSKSSSVVDDELTTLEEEMNDCPMVLSNTNLHKFSLTLLDATQSNDDNEKEGLENNPKIEDSPSKKSKMNYNELEVNVSVANQFPIKGVGQGITNLKAAVGNNEAMVCNQLKDTVNHTDYTSNTISSYSIKSSDKKKLMAKRFFENLLRVYEKEMAVTAQLFQDDDFFVNDLLGFVNDAEEKKKRKGKLTKIIKGKIRSYIGNVFSPKSTREDTQSLCSFSADQSVVKYKHFENISQRKLKMLAFNARRYFSLFVQAVTVNKNINDEIKICGLLKILQRIENGDFTILRTNEEVNFENEIKHQVKEAFVNIYEISVKEAKKHKRSLTIDDLKLIKAFVSKYRIGLLSKTDIIATYIGRGIFKTEKHLSAAVTYLIRIQSKDVDLQEFEEYCKICTSTKK